MLTMDALAFGYMLPVIRAHLGLSPLRTAFVERIKQNNRISTPNTVILFNGTCYNILIYIITSFFPCTK